MELHERIKSARQRTRLSQDDFAARIGVSRGAVAQWEMKAGTAPAVENLVKVATLSGFTFEWVATGRGPRVFGEPDFVLGDRAVEIKGTRDPLDDEVVARVLSLDARRKRALLEILTDRPALPPKRG